MNILYLTNHLNIGGISSYCFTLAAGLKKRGHAVFIASSGGELCERFIREGITYIPIPIRTKLEVSPKVLISLCILMPCIKKYNIDIVHANTRVTQVLACLLQTYTRTPYVSTCHGFFRSKLSRRISPCWGARVIAISEPVQEHLIRDFKVAKEHIEIIHNGIDLEKFRLQDPDSKRQAREKFGLKAGPVIGIIARLSDVKGHAYLIEAMKDVMQHLPTTRLVIAGEGKLKDELTGLIKRLGIEGSVLFLPNTSDTRQVLAALDVFVMPSLAEGLGLGLMEAMACGLAVIGSEVGGIRSLIIDKDNGLLVPPKDTKGLSRAMLELLRDDEKRALFGRRARDFIHRYFSLDEMVLKTEAAYVRCARRRSPRQ